jgi:hypothetical protein
VHTNKNDVVQNPRRFFIFPRLYKTRFPPRVFQETLFDLKDRNIGRKTREKVGFAGKLMATANASTDVCATYT